ncbi:MAG TPA: hypothetical protein VIM02_14095 [Rhizomicrobium sp.]|jgi:hypothetical protein
MHAILYALAWPLRFIIGTLCLLLTPNTFEQAASLVSIIGGGVAAIAAINQYRENQRWKVIEFVVPEMRQFFEREETKAVLRMMDWTEYTASVGKAGIAFDRVKVMNSLVVPPRIRFDSDQAAIRNLFDDFFTHLENLHSYVDRSNRLFKPEILEPYLRYYLRIINKDDCFGLILRNFIDYYDYSGVKTLTRKVLAEQWRGSHL